MLFGPVIHFHFFGSFLTSLFLRGNYSGLCFSWDRWFNNPFLFAFFPGGCLGFTSEFLLVLLSLSLVPRVFREFDDFCVVAVFVPPLSRSAWE